MDPCETCGKECAGISFIRCPIWQEWARAKNEEDEDDYEDDDEDETDVTL